MYNPKQGDIVFLDYNPQLGHGQAGRRLSVVISRNIQFVGKMPRDLLEKTLAYVRTFF